jgi:membrane protease YdiL (CAAX protease family)
MSDSEIPANQNPDGAEPGNLPRTPWGFSEVIMGIVLAVLIGVFFSVAYQELVDDSDRYTLPKLTVALASGWIAYGGVSYLVTRHLPGGLRQLGFWFDFKRDVPKGVLIGVAGQLLVAVVYLPLEIIDSGLVEKLDEPAKRLSDAMGGWRWLVFSVFVGVISPICEELFFRGITLRAIASRWGNAIGIVGSGIIFGLIHFQGLQTLALTAFGMLLAWRAVRTGRIGETVIAHGVFNLITVLALVTGVT